MKKILTILLIAIYSCSNGQESNINFIDKFINDVIVKNSTEPNELNKYLSIHSDSLTKESEVYKLVKFNISFLHNELNKFNNEYEILSYIDFKKQSVYKDYKVIYDNLDEVYILTINGEFYTPIVIQNEKIISFSTGIIKNKNRIIPHIL